MKGVGSLELAHSSKSALPGLPGGQPAVLTVPSHSCSLFWIIKSLPLKWSVPGDSFPTCAQTDKHDMKVGRNPWYRRLLQDPKGKSRGGGLASLRRHRKSHCGQARQEGRGERNTLQGNGGSDERRKGRGSYSYSWWKGSQWHEVTPFNGHIPLLNWEATKLHEGQQHGPQLGSYCHDLGQRILQSVFQFFQEVFGFSSVLQTSFPHSFHSFMEFIINFLTVLGFLKFSFDAFIVLHYL